MDKNWQTLEKDKDGNIISVKRLSNNTIFNINDNIRTGTDYWKIGKFVIQGNQLMAYSESGSGYYLDQLQKIAASEVPKNFEFIKEVVNTLDKFKNENNELINEIIILNPSLTYQDATLLLLFHRMQKDIDIIKSKDLLAKAV